MFRNFINEIFFEKIDLIVLFNAFFYGGREIFYRSHERHFSFHFFSPTIGFHRLGGINSCRPASFGMVHSLISICNTLGIDYVFRILRNIVKIDEIGISDQVLSLRKTGRKETKMFDIGV